jgi:hypothetical protein
MTTKPENLAQQGYRLSAELTHTDMIPFIKEYFKKANLITLFYWSFNIIILLGIIWFSIANTQLDFSEKFDKFFLGVFFFFLLLPFHELIHGAVYKFFGAEKVLYRAVWKKMMFYAIAPMFVADSREFKFVAYAPFILINSALILTGCFVEESFQWILAGTLLFHTAGCSGDFGLISYFYENKNKKVVTYDDAENGKTFFYTKPIN